MLSRKFCAIVAAGVLLASGVGAQAIVMETVPVGNPGNAGEWSGESYGGFGPDRICGAVDYTYNIGKYEVTAGQYCEFLNKVAGVDTYGLYNECMDIDSGLFRAECGCNIKRHGTSGNYTYSVAGDYANRPVNYVSYWDSCRFANWLHNGQPTGAQGAGTTETGAYTLNGYNGEDGGEIQRNPGSRWAITSEDEWYKAAYHKNDGVTGNYWDYPTSSNNVPSRDLNDVSGNNANCYGDPLPIDSPYYTTLVGEFQNSDSPYGTFDQGGNVWEWNEAVLYGSFRCMRGGSFYKSGYYLHASSRYDVSPTIEVYLTGFRVSEVPEPGSALLLLIGCAGMLLRKRRA